MESVTVHASQLQSTVLSATVAYTVVIVLRSMSGCWTKVLRTLTCDVAFLIFDLTSILSHRSGVRIFFHFLRFPEVDGSSVKDS
jgi:hypothetical protein